MKKTLVRVTWITCMIFKYTCVFWAPMRHLLAWNPRALHTYSFKERKIWLLYEKEGFQIALSKKTQSIAWLNRKELPKVVYALAEPLMPSNPKRAPSTCSKLSWLHINYKERWWHKNPWAGNQDKILAIYS